MLKHIVMWKFAPEAEGKTRDENLDYVIGKDVLGSEMSYDCGLIVEFDSLEDMRIYKDHPLHVAVSQYVKKVRTDRATVDFYD